jgi:Na+-driven multidrug efflux pump
MQLWGYAQMPMFAVAGAVGAMAAQTVGAQRWERMPKITLAGLGLTAVMTGSAVVALYLADEALLRLFLPEGGETLRQALRIDDLVLPTYALLSFTIVLFSVTRATGAVVAPLLIFFTALWLARVPFAELMIPRLGADAIWLSFPLGATVSLIGASLYYRYGPWRARRPAVLGEAQPA